VAAAEPVVNDSATPLLMTDENVDAAEQTDGIFEYLSELSGAASFEEARE